MVLLGPGLLGLGCAVGPDFHRPAVPADRGYTADPASSTTVADGKTQHFVEGERVAADWWRLLECPALDAIVVEAIAANPGLEAARASLRRSQDSLRAGYGVFLPQANLSAGASRQRYNPAPGVLPASEFNLFSLSGSVSYALDIWGSARRQVEGLRAQVDEQRFALAGTYVMLAGNVVDAVIAQAAYRDEIAATTAAITLQREQLRITEAQAAGGTVPYANVLSIQSQIASAEAAVPSLEQKIDQAAHLLAALSGRTPAEWKQPRLVLSDLHLPSDVPVTLPSELVRQRPDILVAEANLHAANASIGVATAAMLPSLTLSAGYGVNGTAPGDLSSPSASLWNVAAALTQPLFRGGTLYYQRKAAVDARDQAAAEYRQTVLAAFQQVADSLRGLQHDADALAAQTEAVQSVEKALHLIQANYQAGIATYLQVLIADQQYLQSKTGYVAAVAARLQDSVALYVALGGGWWNAAKVGG